MKRPPAGRGNRPEPKARLHRVSGVVRLVSLGIGAGALGCVGHQGVSPRNTDQPAPTSRCVLNLEAGKPQHVVTYGTSLTAGGAWVGLLRAALEERYPGLATVTNSGAGAMWSQWGVENLRERVVEKRPDVLVVEFSVNDAYLPYDTSIEVSRLNLEYIVDRTLAAHPDCEIVLMTMNPCIGEHFEQRPRIEEYYQVYRDVARERGLLLIDHYPNWRPILDGDKEAFGRYVPDGLHPGPLGCEKVVLPAILAGLGL